jgi:cobalt-precorrin-5B (C1)-methyltransferase
MIDPVTGFSYPDAWMKRCRDPDLLGQVREGLAVLTASGTVLRRGFTTGTTAAAACKAAVLSQQRDVASVSIRIPCGLVVDVPVEARAGRASCRKYAGDYPADATAGIEFIATTSVLPDRIRLVPGTGIGRFSRDTPRYPRGTPAISPAPLGCILASIEEALAMIGSSGGISVTLSAPEGEQIAQKTLNPRVGVEGGISVLGTTGLVEPWDDHLQESVRERVAAAKDAVITTGRIGMRYARLLFPDREVVLAGGKIGEALAIAKGDVVLCGLPALILRFIDPAILDGSGYLTIEELAASRDFDRIVRPALAAFHATHPHVRVVLLSREGGIIGERP